MAKICNLKQFAELSLNNFLSDTEIFSEINKFKNHRKFRLTKVASFRIPNRARNYSCRMALRIIVFMYLPHL